MYRNACNRGHPYVDGSYVWRSDGSRKCRICARIKREEARRAKGQAKRPLKRNRPQPQA